jgi:hypothetical protein
MRRVFTPATPLPARIPERVVEPVPPYCTESVVDAESTPVALVVSTPAAKLENWTVLVARSAPAKYEEPLTVSFADGEVVPMPTFPEASILIALLPLFVRICRPPVPPSR